MNGPKQGRHEQRSVLMLGAGHAHLLALKRAADYARHGCCLTVASPDDFWYSGMATGMLGGIYTPEQDRIEIAPLAHAGGAAFIRASACRIDAQRQTVSFDDGRIARYDVLSLAIGSVVDELPGQRDNGRIFSVKPISRLSDLRTFLEIAFRRRPCRSDAATRVVIAGGGHTGCEVAANISALAERHRAPLRITLVAGTARLLQSQPRAAAETLRRFLQRRNVDLMLDRHVIRIESSVVRLSDGSTAEFDALVNATGLKPHPLIAQSGLTVDDEGDLLVDEHLGSVTDRRIFGGGDCIAIAGKQLPKIGVYAIREAPILHHNLIAAARADPLRRFRPQRRFLSILNLGDGSGLALRGRLWWRGRSAQRLKDWIDRRFVDRHRA